MNQYRCKHCGSWFEATEDDLKDWGKFCSEEHANIYVKELNEFIKKERNLK